MGASTAYHKSEFLSKEVFKSLVKDHFYLRACEQWDPMRIAFRVCLRQWSRHNPVVILPHPVIVAFLLLRCVAQYMHDHCEVPPWFGKVEEVVAILSNIYWVCWVFAKV